MSIIGWGYMIKISCRFVQSWNYFTINIMIIKKTGLICYWVNWNSPQISVKMLVEYEFFLETAVIIGEHLKNCSKHYIFNTKKETKILRKSYSVCCQNIHQVIE